MSNPSNPFVSGKRWEEMSWEEYDQPDLVTTMIQAREYKARIAELELELARAKCPRMPHVENWCVFPRCNCELDEKMTKLRSEVKP